jgi:hypothetical protein
MMILMKMMNLERNDSGLVDSLNQFHLCEWLKPDKVSLRSRLIKKTVRRGRSEGETRRTLCCTLIF